MIRYAVFCPVALPPSRYPAETEATVYFCCLEAIQNTGKHAGDSATLSLRVDSAPGRGTQVTGSLPLQQAAGPSRDVEVEARTEQPGQDDVQGIHRLGPVAAPVVLQDYRPGTGVVHDVADNPPDPWPCPVTRVDRPVHRHHPHLLALPDDEGRPGPVRGAEQLGMHAGR